MVYAAQFDSCPTSGAAAYSYSSGEKVLYQILQKARVWFYFCEKIK